MALVKVYTYEDTREAIERADGKCINVYKMVRNDISNQDWTKKNIKLKHRDKSLPAELQWPGHKDVGHTFRHVEGTHVEGKSTYSDQHTAISVTMQILNSTEGEAAINQLAAQNLSIYNNATIRVTAEITGTWYGKSGQNTDRRIIESARCEIMKLGDQLWIHSSYPRTFKSKVESMIGFYESLSS